MSRVPSPSPRRRRWPTSSTDARRRASPPGRRRCLWCGGEVGAAVADRWTRTRRPALPVCGSELEGRVGGVRARRGVSSAAARLQGATCPGLAGAARAAAVAAGRPGRACAGRRARRLAGLRASRCSSCSCSSPFGPACGSQRDRDSDVFDGRAYQVRAATRCGRSPPRVRRPRSTCGRSSTTIREANGLDGALLQPGQTLTLPYIEE